MFTTFIAGLDKTDLYVAVIAAFGALVLFRFNKQLQSGNYDHFWQNLDKFLLAGMAVLLLGLNLHMIHHGADLTSLGWIQNTTGQVLAAFLAVLGAKTLQSRAGTNGNGNGSPKPPYPPLPSPDPPKI